MPKLTPEQLEALMARTLRNLPERPAPRGLENRVLAAIAAKQTRPWWQQDYAHWPLPARVGFFVLSAVVAAALVAFGLHLMQGVEASVGTGEISRWTLAWHELQANLSALASLARRYLPTVTYGPWFYGIIAFVATSYAVLMGTGAVLYRAYRRTH